MPLRYGSTRWIAAVLPGLVAALVIMWLIGWGRDADLREPAAAVAATTTNAAQPRAVVVNNVHELGVMNPGDEQHHRFEIRNEGSAELVLTLGSTTCKCTLAKFDELHIPPGKSDFIELEWHAEEPQFRFKQGAVIHSNDPRLKSFELIGAGTVLVKLAAVPETAYLADVPRNTSRTLSVLFYSQAFTEIAIEKIESTTGKSSGTIAATSAEAAPPEHATFHRDVLVEFLPQASPGHYDDLLHIAYVGTLPGGAKEHGTFHLPVSYDVAGDISLHGRDIVGNTLVLGTVSQAKGVSRQFYVHVRGATLAELQPSVRSTVPDVMQVRIGEAQQLTPSIARIPIAVEFRGGGKSASAESLAAAQLEISTGRPVDSPVSVPVSFVLSP